METHHHAAHHATQARRGASSRSRKGVAQDSDSLMAALYGGRDAPSLLRLNGRPRLSAFLLALLGVCDTVLFLVFVCIPDERFEASATAGDPQDLSKTGSEGNAGRVARYGAGVTSTGGENQQLLYYQLAAAILCVVLSAGSMVLIFASFLRKKVTTLLATILLKVLSLLLAITILAFPTSMRIGFVWTYISLLLGEVVLVAWLLMRSRRFYRPVVVPVLHVAEQQLEVAQVDRLNRWLVIEDSRALLLRLFKLGQTLVAVLAALIFLLSLASLIYQASVLVSKQGAFYTTSQLEELSKASIPASYFGQNRSHTDNARVLMVVLEGLTEDGMQSNEQFSALLRADWFAMDSRVSKIQSALPTTSRSNWATLLTGASPEITGILGNAWNAQTHFDSLLQKCHQWGLRSGVSGAPEFAELFRDQLEPLFGDGSIQTDIGEPPGDWTSAAAADRLRAELAERAMRDLGYDFFVLHFSDIDLQGHRAGLTDVYNSLDTYQGAISNTTKLLERLLTQVDGQTWVVLVSDHGQVAPGGHGGSTDEQRNVPFILYRRGSGLGNFSQPLLARVDPIPINDVVPTMAALLGVPVPRQNGGMFMEDILRDIYQGRTNLLQLHYLDLLRQQQSFVYHMLYSELDGDADNAALQPQLTSNTSTVAELTTQIAAVRQLYADERSAARSKYIARNVLVTMVIVFVLLFTVVYVMQLVTMTDPLLIFSMRRHPDKLANVYAFLVTLALHLIYYLACVGIYALTVFGRGYDHWDLAALSNLAALSIYLRDTLVPAFVFTYALIRVTYMLTMTRHSFHRGVLPSIVNVFFRFDGDNLRMLYLFKYYNVAWSLASILLLWVLQGSYSFIFPFVYDVRFLTERSWDLRFRVLTATLITMPLLFGNIIMLLVWPVFERHKARFDQLSTLGISKHQRYAKYDRFQVPRGAAAVPLLFSQEEMKPLYEHYDVRSFFDLAAIDPHAPVDAAPQQAQELVEVTPPPPASPKTKKKTTGEQQQVAHEAEQPSPSRRRRTGSRSSSPQPEEAGEAGLTASGRTRRKKTIEHEEDVE